MDRMEYDWIERLWADTLGRSRGVLRKADDYLDGWTDSKAKPTPAQIFRFVIFFVVLILASWAIVNLAQYYMYRIS